MVILGLNPGIDSSAALVVDGRVVAAAEEERLSRIKMHLGFPRRAIREVLRLSGVPPRAVEAVTFSFRDYLYAHPTVTRLFLQENGCPFDPENPLHPWRLSRLLLKTVSAADMFPMSFGISDPANYDRNQRTYLEELRGLDIHVPTLVDVRHHVCHAASAYYTSGFDACLVVTADGAGDGACLTISAWPGGASRAVARPAKFRVAGCVLRERDRAPGLQSTSPRRKDHGPGGLRESRRVQ